MAPLPEAARRRRQALRPALPAVTQRRRLWPPNGDGVLAVPLRTRASAAGNGAQQPRGRRRVRRRRAQLCAISKAMIDRVVLTGLQFPREHVRRWKFTLDAPLAGKDSYIINTYGRHRLAHTL